eukprot:gene8167-biopygen15143
MWVKYCGAAGAAKIAIGESLSGRRPRRGAHRVPAGRRYGRGTRLRRRVPRLRGLRRSRIGRRGGSARCPVAGAALSSEPLVPLLPLRNSPVLGGAGGE